MPWLSVVAHAAPPLQPMEVLPDAARAPVWQGLRIVAPADRHISPERAAELALSDAALTIDNPAHILGRATSPYWAWFSLHNAQAAEQHWLLALESTTQFDTLLFQRDAMGAWRPVKSLADGASGRIGSGTTFPVWPLPSASQQTTEFLLRIEGPAIVRFPLFVYHPTAFVEAQRQTHLALGLALGSCIMFGVYLATLRRYLDDQSLPLFLCMLMANLLGALWLSGFLSELFPALPESTLSPVGFAAFALLFGSGSLHARIYLNTTAWAPRVDRLLQVLAWLWLALAPWFAVVFPVAARVLMVWGGTAIAVILVAVSTLAARRNIPFSGFIAAAWVVHLLISASFAFARAIDTPLLWPSSTLTLGQATITTMLFGFAMSQRLLQQRDVLVTARQEALMQHEKTAAIMRERSRLFAATNHDLRQPLFGVAMFANLLKAARTSEERTTHALKLNGALKEVDDLLVSIQQLAAVHEASHHPLFARVQLDDLLLPLVEEYRGRSEYKHINLRYVPSRLSIVTHAPYFQRIVRNVLANAVRYTDRGDRILVGCRRGGGLRLMIADTGRGMSAEQSQQAFDAFRRFEAMPSPDGFGLGLFSTKSLADALGLTISLHSQRGRGTEFSVYISPGQENMP